MLGSKFFAKFKTSDKGAPLVHNLDQKLMRQSASRPLAFLGATKIFASFLKPQRKKIISLLLFLVLISVLTWSAAWLINNRIAVPAAGGEYNEAIIGAPKTINPLFPF